MRKTIKTDVKNIISDLTPEQLRWLSCVCNVKLSRNFDSLKEVTETDVIIEVLDSRDPEGCRSTEIENEALR